MRNWRYYISCLFLLFSHPGCKKEKITNDNNTIIVVDPEIIDEDNLAEEQIVNNLSLFFTEPGSNTFTHSFVNVSYTTSGDYQIVSLPIEPAELQTKNVYAIANYDNENDLNNAASVIDLQDLFTPEVDKNNNLDPAKGFCMYGSLPSFDFTTGETAIVDIIRTCAKLRINLQFPDGYELSTRNSFLIQQAAKYTYVIKNSTSVLPQSDYFNFASALPLTDNGTGMYTNTAYVYEAPTAPILTIYTHLNNSIEEQEFTATLPIPQRNYLYDLIVEIFESETRGSTQTKSTIRAKMTINRYNEKGIQHHEKTELLFE